MIHNNQFFHNEILQCIRSILLQYWQIMGLILVVGDTNEDYPSKHETLNQCWFNAGPESETHWFSVSCLLGSNSVYTRIVLTYRANRQYLLTLQVSRYCLDTAFWAVYTYRARVTLTLKPPTGPYKLLLIGSNSGHCKMAPLENIEGPLLARQKTSQQAGKGAVVHRCLNAEFSVITPSVQGIRGTRRFETSA